MKKKAQTQQTDPDRYLNRELSWLQFNKRVLEEGKNPANPLLERLKFLAIFESNLDEFYMVRVSGLVDQYENGLSELTPDGLTPAEQLQLVAQAALPLRREAGAALREVLDELAEAGVVVHRYADLAGKQRSDLEAYFRKEVFPLCTPLILHPAPSVPFISNRSLNLAVELEDKGSATKLARVKIPTIIPRVAKLPGSKRDFVMLEDVIANNLHYLFPGVQIVGAHQFRVVRDADIEIRELEAADLISTIEESLRMRRFGAPVMLQTHSTMPKRVRTVLLKALELTEEELFSMDSILGMEAFWDLYKIDRPSLRYPPHVPYLKDSLGNAGRLFETVRRTDVLVHHPYDSFRSVEAFVASAAQDPNVFGIKQTLYRVGSESPIVQSLLDAARIDKQVAVLVELKARFDESNNLVWARALERAGAHVTYGFPEKKTHCKLCLIVRREQGKVRSYAHIGTGNYNPLTARQYTDLGLFTCDSDVTQDVNDLFNYLTGFSKQSQYRKLLVAPLNLREGIIDRIHREIEAFQRTKQGRIFFKLNSLVDPEAIDALYEASCAGLPVDLVVRGICCLKPGVPGLSENVRVLSIVGRYLEHSRVYYFANGGNPEALIGSADLMRRNLDRRIEALVPVSDPDLVKVLLQNVLEPCFKDNQKAWCLCSDGSYVRREPTGSEKEFEVQRYLANHSATKAQFGKSGNGR
jgi:polyphosphate kinase